MKETVERAVNSHDANILTRAIIALWLRHLTLWWFFWFVTILATVGWGVALYLGMQYGQ